MPQPISNVVKTKGLIQPMSFAPGLGANFGSPSNVQNTAPMNGQSLRPGYQAPSLENLQNKSSTLAIAPTSTKVSNPSGIGSSVRENPMTAPKINSLAGFLPANTGNNPGSGVTLSGGGSQTGGGSSTGQDNNTLASGGGFVPPNTTGQKAPAGMEYDAQGNLVPASQQSGPSGPNITFPGLVSRAAGLSAQPSDIFTRESSAALGYQDELSRLKNEQAHGIANIQNSGTPMSQALGEAGAINSLYASRENAAATAFQGASSLLPSATNQQNSQIQGTMGAAGLISPQLGGFNQQYFNPLGGQGATGGNSGNALGQLPPQAQTAVQSYAEQVKNGSMTRADAENRLSAYGVAGTNALNEVLGNDFNTNASNASASTTQQGQQLQTAAHATTQALDSLQTLFGNLSKAQTGGIPLTNSIANWISSQLGSSALTQYNQTLHDARAQLQGVLTASGGATPTGAEAMAMTYLPDNMTGGQLSAAISNVKNLIQQKVSSFTQSGQQNGSQSGNSGGVINTPYGAINPNL